MTTPQSFDHSNSPDPSSPRNLPVLSMDTSQADLLKIVWQHEVDKNTAQAELKCLSRTLADINNNNNNSSGHKRKHRRIRHESPLEDSDEPEDMETITPERFKNDKNKSQGQLKEVLDLLQVKFQPQALQKRWLRRQIHHTCASILGASENDLLKSDTRKARFCKEIGWTDETGLYLSVDVPILHKNWNGEYVLSSVFLNLKLMGLYVALIRGPRAGKLFMNGESIHPPTEMMASIHNIHNITPGAITTCAVLARWALSADEALQEVGLSTGICYFSDFKEYLMILETGLCQKKRSVINIIKQWDERIFPDSDLSLVKDNFKKSDKSSGLKKTMALLAADSKEVEDHTEV